MSYCSKQIVGRIPSKKLGSEREMVVVKDNRKRKVIKGISIGSVGSTELSVLLLYCSEGWNSEEAKEALFPQLDLASIISESGVRVS